MIKVARFWTKRVKDLVKTYNDLSHKHDPAEVQPVLQSLLELLGDRSADPKERVMVTFVLEEIRAFGPLTGWVVDSLVDVLDAEQNPNVREFVTWVLGKIVVGERDLDLANRVKPTLESALKDPNDRVVSFAKEALADIEDLRREFERQERQLQVNLAEFEKVVEEAVADVVRRANEISRIALSLGFKEAATEKERIERKIRRFNRNNESLESKVLKSRQKLGEGLVGFDKASEPLVRRWKETRTEREDLVRKVHCILRIQSKIYKIYAFVQSRGTNEPLTEQELEEIQAQTQYSKEDVLKILEELVEEEMKPALSLPPRQGSSGDGDGEQGEERGWDAERDAERG
ncbi:MAG: hypothetical protein Kow0069_07230 [Promethearchaeota archaeon]